MACRKKITLELDVYVEEYEAGEYTVSLIHPDLKGFLKFDSFDENEIETVLDDMHIEPETVEVVKEVQVVKEVEVIKEVVKPYEPPANPLMAAADDILEIKNLLGRFKNR